MKNSPYFNRGGTCEIRKYTLSFKGDLKELEFTTFKDFVKRADKIIYVYNKHIKEIDLKAYKDYIYSKKLNKEKSIDNAMKEKCFEWIISYQYHDTTINDLYSILGMVKGGKK